MVLNENNKDIYINYCMRLCMIGIKDNGIKIENISQLKGYVTEEISYALYNKKKYGSFNSLLVLSRNILMKEYKIGLINIEERLNLTKSGNEYFLKSLIEYYQIIFEFNINIRNGIEPIENKEKKLQEGKRLIDSSIKRYICDDMNISFAIYIKRMIEKFNFENRIKTDSKEKNTIIDIKNGNYENIDYLYNLYFKLMKKAVQNKSLLPEDKFNKFLYAYTKEKIDNYFSSNPTSTLRNYMSTFILRLADSSSEYLIIKYNLYFNDFYDESLELLFGIGNKMVDELLRKNKISNVVISYELKTYVKDRYKEHLEKCIKEGKVVSISGVLNKKAMSILKSYLKKEKKFQTEFDFELAKYGNLDEKEKQEAILLRDLKYLIEKAENKFIYYTEYENVRQKVEETYIKDIHAYVYKIIERLSQSSKLSKPETYISMRIFDDMKRFSVSTKRKFVSSCKVYDFEMSCNPIINDFISKQPECFDVDMFNSYVKRAIKSYIDAGSYKEDIRIYISKIISDYNYDFAKQLDEIISYEQDEVKVLRRPIIK